jgi:SlyX protein
MNDDRLVEIETKLAYQEDTIQQLNDVICQQQKQIDRLELLCEHLLERIKTNPETQTLGAAIDEKPPHY